MIANQFKVISKLGEGATSKVYLVETTDSTHYACKVMRSTENDQQLMNDVRQEIILQSNFNHENIVKIISVGKGVFDKYNGNEPKEVLYIVTELASNGELFDLVAAAKAFDEETARYYFRQLMSAVFYLHNQFGVCHRDLKLENIFLDDQFNVKLGDFGFATSIVGPKGIGKLYSYKGTISYMPPEQHARIAYCGRKADLFALGSILFIMVSKCQPFQFAKTRDHCYRYIAGNRPDLFWKIFSRQGINFSDDLKDLLTGMFQLNVEARYSIDEILAHPWFNGPVPSKEKINFEMSKRVKI